jgi:transcriptional regulator with XRE-family HTH domain
MRAAFRTPVYLRIAGLRQAKGWSQSELSRRSGVPQSTISRLEAGKLTTVSLGQLGQLAEALGIHAGLLIAHPAAERKAKHT